MTLDDRDSTLVTPDRTDSEGNGRTSPFLCVETDSPLPYYIKFLLSTWFYKTSHDFCEYEDLEKISTQHQNFDEIVEISGKVIRRPKLLNKNGKVTHVYKYLEFESNCRLCYRCKLCGWAMCQNPKRFTSNYSPPPCMPVPLNTLRKLDIYTDAEDYILYYLTKKHSDLDLLGIDSNEILRKYSREGESNFAAEYTLQQINTHENSGEIKEYIRNKLGLFLET